MSRINLEDSEIRRPKIFGMVVSDIAAFGSVATPQSTTLTLTRDMSSPVYVNPGANVGVKVLLPALLKGLDITIINTATATGTLAVRNPGDTADVGAALTFGTSARYICDGVAWRRVG